MASISFILLCNIILTFTLLNTVMLFKLYSPNENLSSDFIADPNESSLIDADMSPQLIDDSITDYDQGDKDNVDNSNEQPYRWITTISKIKPYHHLLPTSYSKRSNVPLQQKFRPHWSPLVAAYKRCGELTRDEREICFKSAVQMLFVHKLK